MVSNKQYAIFGIIVAIALGGVTFVSQYQSENRIIDEINFLKEEYLSNSKIFESQFETNQNYLQELEIERKNAEEVADSEEEKRIEMEMDFLSQAGDFLSEGKFDEAISIYNILLEHDPNESTYSYLKGVSLISKGEFEESILSFDLAIKNHDPLDDIVFDTLVLSYDAKIKSFINFEKYDDAMRTTNTALEIYPDAPLFYYEKAVIYGLTGEHENSLLYFEKSLELHPFFVDALIGKGVALSYLGSPNESIEYYNRALEIEPDNEYAIKNKETAIKNMNMYQ